jgi:hypothetical protein
MKKLCILYLLAMISANTTSGQCNYNKSNNTISVWDWRQPFYTEMFVIGEPNLPFYSPPGAIPGTGVPSPFIPPSSGSTNTNLGKFYTQYAATNSLSSVDCQPSEGWELFAKEFGTSAVPLNTPFFCLYNRHTGILRAFFLAVQLPTSPQNGATVSMRHEPDAGIFRESALFSHLYPITNPVENFVKGSIMSSPNYYINQKGYWLYADFPMAYDPCVCQYNSKITFEFKTTSQMSVVLKANIEGYFNQTISSTPGNVKSKENIFDVAGNIVKSGNQSFDSWSKSVEGIEKFADKQELDLKNQILFGTTKMKSFLTAIPYLGAAFGVIDYFQSLNKTGASSPMHFGANLEFNGIGSIIQSSSYGTFTYWTPGSNQNVVTEKTIYDNPLGVISFLKPIKIDYVDYRNKANGDGLNWPPIRQYKIAEPIKYALNPSAQVEIIDIQASLVIKYDPIPTQNFNRNLNTGGGYGVFFPRPVGFAFTPNFMDKVRSVGLETEIFAFNPNKDSVMVSLRTPYVPLSCFENVSIFLHRNHDWAEADPHNNGYLNLAVKFIIKAKVKTNNMGNNDGENSSINGKEVIFVQTYFVNEQESEFNNGNNMHRWEENDNQFPTFYTHKGNAPAMDAPFTLAKLDATLQNMTITSGISVMRSLKLGTNLTISSTVPINMKAGYEILVEQDTYIGSETTLMIGLPNIDCDYNIKPMQYTQDEIHEEINAFCNPGGKYSNHSLSKKSIEDETKSKTPINKPEFIDVVAVNPFGSVIRLNYSLIADGNVSVILYNMTGKQMVQLDLQNNKQGTYEENIDISQFNLPEGVYVLEFKAVNSNTKRIKLVKSSR